MGKKSPLRPYPVRCAQLVSGDMPTTLLSSVACSGTDNFALTAALARAGTWTLRVAYAGVALPDSGAAGRTVWVAVGDPNAAHSEVAWWWASGGADGNATVVRANLTGLRGPECLARE